MNVPSEVIGIIVVIFAGLFYAVLGYAQDASPFNPKRFLYTLMTTWISGLLLVGTVPITDWLEYIALFLAVIGVDAIRTTRSPAPAAKAEALATTTPAS